MFLLIPFVTKSIRSDRGSLIKRRGTAQSVTESKMVELVLNVFERIHHPALDNCAFVAFPMPTVN